MASPDPRVARFQGLWTAGWLAALLLAGLLWLGDLSLQWPVLLVPLLWALVAVRPRRRPRDRAEEDDHSWDDEPWPPSDPDVGWAGHASPDHGHRTDTVERPAVGNGPVRPRTGYPRDSWD